MQTATLIIPIDNTELSFKPMRSTVKSRRKQWTGYKRCLERIKDETICHQRKSKVNQVTDEKFNKK